jgi:hypothetical protein
LGNIAIYYYSTCIQNKTPQNKKEEDSRKVSGETNCSKNGIGYPKEVLGDENSNYAPSNYFTSYLNKMSNLNETHLKHRRASGNTILCNDSNTKQNSVEEKHIRKSKSRKNSASSSENEDI